MSSIAERLVQHRRKLDEIVADFVQPLHPGSSIACEVATCDLLSRRNLLAHEYFKTGENVAVCRLRVARFR